MVPIRQSRLGLARMVGAAALLFILLRVYQADMSSFGLYLPKSVTEHLPNTNSGSGPIHPGSALRRLPSVAQQEKEAQERDPGHYPSYDGYKDKDYDPNRWHFLPFETGFYDSTLVTSKDNAHPYPPYSDDPKTVLLHDKEPKACMGPRGKRLNESTDDATSAYGVKSKTFPEPAFGSFEALNLDGNICFDRFSRYGPYGFGSETDEVGITRDNAERKDINWSAVRWGNLQDICETENAVRFAPKPSRKVGQADGLGRNQEKSNNGDVNNIEARRLKQLAGSAKRDEEAAHVRRSAVLIRTWESYEYTLNDLQVIRSLVEELALSSGGEYRVVLFVNVKDKHTPIFQDQQVYQEVLERSVPEEFRDMAVLWTEEVCESLYPNVGNNEVYFQQFQPIQWFAQEHPEYDYIWNWEMDVRYTGHLREFLTKVTKFANAQPRKYLWERSSRFYIPSIHGSWKHYIKHIAQLTPSTSSVWGPVPAAETNQEMAILPQTTMANDDYTWGIGEEADLITMLPFFDPQNTYWVQRDKIWNFAQGNTTPRRAFINTLARFSRRQLDVMHYENQQGRSMASEMWPATVALHYGLKAVYAPHPIWTSHRWPADYADEVFNAGAETAPASGLDSVYNPDREHNFGGLSWYFWSMFPGTLYRRWLGWNVTDDRGESIGGKEWEEKVGGRMCLPPMLLHPVKNVTLG